MSSMYFKFSGTYITFLPRQTISASYVTLQFFDFLSWKKVGYRSLFQSTNAHQVSSTDGPIEEILNKGTTTVHVTALDGLVNVNSLFTVAVFVGLSLATPGQRSLDDSGTCNADQAWCIVLWEQLHCKGDYKSGWFSFNSPDYLYFYCLLCLYSLEQ
ncbi:uncharacterized protein LOC131070908 isoform X4 [Cryptomeria japonica]|uniref:uncharacterized protein LOC131070908 isoform X4 n=1 Tax=Cryptomeria japonica TaxID=3369 RepID=UPI0025AD2B0C|nr:uncharacterized protein LOC131070908 isoform X4 [Cryptomeria japonica]